MNTVRRSDRLDGEITINLDGPRPVFDTLKPLEVDALPATPTAIKHDVQALRDKVVAQRVRSLAFAVGGAVLLAIVGVSGAGAIAKSEAERALDRVHTHVAAANAALPNAATELPPPAVVEAPKPTAVPGVVAPIPVNGGTPAFVLAPGGAKPRHHK
jgi:hypothetical protein